MELFATAGSVKFSVNSSLLVTSHTVQLSSPTASLGAAGASVFVSAAE